MTFKSIENQNMMEEDNSILKSFGDFGVESDK